ncbi:MAG: methylated-DNA--[protein]-cysteine S-methyltransferase [Anaerolineae bacterium]
MTANPIFLLSSATPFGTVSIVWQGAPRRPIVNRIFLSHGDAGSEARAQAMFDDLRPGTDPAVDELLQDIRRYLEGEVVPLKLDLLALDACSDFQRRVLLAEYAIPRGYVSTYGRIAHHLGVRGGARAVGNALARNPFPIVIPCHRAIRSDGELGGYQGGTAMKRALLVMEGVEVSGSGRVVRSQFHC